MKKDGLQEPAKEDNVSEREIQTVRELLDTAARDYGNRTFIKFADGDNIIEKSYITLRDNSYAISRYIRSFSQERMHIAIIGKTNYEYLTCLTGILISANVSVPFAPDISVEEACDLFERADIDMLFYEDDFEPSAQEISRRYGKFKNMVNLGSRETFEEIYKKYSEDSEYAYLSEVETDPEKCAAIIFTSGTTGKRKGVMLSTRNLISNINYKELEFGEDDVVLSVLPMHHIFCYSGDFLKTIKDGVAVCLNGDLSQIGRNLQRFEPTIIRAVPMICSTLLRKVQAYERRNPDLTPRQAAEAVFGRRFKWLISAGAYLSPKLVSDYAKYGIMLRQGYGMTETGPRVSVSVFSDYRADSSGKIISICQVRTQNGEIQVKSPSVMMGYYKDPEETKAAFTEDGWLKTGDLGRITDDGYIYITGRVKNLIILSNGENISAEEIERRFCDEPLVKEVVAYGENDMITAEIFPDTTYAQEHGVEDIRSSLEMLIHKANENANAYTEIGALKIRETPFPKTASGKIKRNIVTF